MIKCDFCETEGIHFIYIDGKTVTRCMEHWLEHEKNQGLRESTAHYLRKKDEQKDR